MPANPFVLAARVECLRCRGREFGDCGGVDCRYWVLTATDAEIELAAIRAAGGAGRSWRLWEGPVWRGAEEMEVA